MYLRQFLKILKKILLALSKRLNLIILAIFVIVILYAAFIFYFYAYLPSQITPEAILEKVEIKKGVFQRVQERFEAREVNVSEAMEKGYWDVFR